MQKKLQWILALASTILLIRGFYYIDPDFLTYAGHSVILRTVQYIVIVPILLWVVLFSNERLYALWLGQSKIKNILTYSRFQKLFTFYHILIFIILLYANITWVKL